MGWAETAKRVSELVVRPVIVKDGENDKKPEMGVGLFVGDECKFCLPMNTVNGTNDYEKLTDDIRLVIELAIIKAWGWEKLVGQ